MQDAIAPERTMDFEVKRILQSAEFLAAKALIERDQERFVEELIALTNIPAPPFKEELRAKAYLGMLRNHGLSDTEIDPEGNVMGLRKGSSDGPILVVAAHLDTVFPPETVVKVKRQGNRLAAPGVGDNTRGAALLLAVVRAMNAGAFKTESDILFVGTVGEEGEGDLRGVKHLLKKGKYRERIGQFIAIDVRDQSIITRGAVGSKRFRVTFKGPGGHSYGDFGLVSPAFAMSEAISELSKLTVPAKPKTTFNVGIVAGGTSVNSVPAEMEILVDMRSESYVELNKLSELFFGIVQKSISEENGARSTAKGRIEVTMELIGERPCGETPVELPIVQKAIAVLRAFDIEPRFRFGSTDASFAMGLGIPAIVIGRGGRGGRSHSLSEWVDVEPEAQAQAVQVALTIILAVASCIGLHSAS
jgi:acetylornithine deacetylase/succinyl-diaminopimelate desuccinylase-like protein